MFDRIYEIYVVFTRDCNLRCSYCYQNKTNKKITKDILDKTIKFIKEYEKIHYINLFGGEAFLELDSIEYLIDNLIDIKNKTGRDFTIYTNTNGTIYNEKFLKLINKISNNFTFRYVISIDGNKEFHDSKRKTISGKPTYDLIMNNVKKIRENSPKTFVDFHTVIQTEMCSDFYKISKEILRNPIFDWGAFEFLAKGDGNLHYSVKDLENVYKAIMKLNQEGYSLKFLLLRFNNIIKVLDYRYNNFLRGKEYCSNGETAVAIDYDGKVYPCDFYLSLPENTQKKFSIYDLNTKKYKNNMERLNCLGIEKEEQESICNKCEAKQFCYICTAVKDIIGDLGFKLECEHNKRINKALQNIKFSIK